MAFYRQCVPHLQVTHTPIALASCFQADAQHRHTTAAVQSCSCSYLERIAARDLGAGTRRATSSGQKQQLQGFLRSAAMIEVVLNDRLGKKVS